MKYEITYSCGHTGTVEIYGSRKDRERKLNWYKTSAVCPNCYKSQRESEAAAHCDAVRMSYRTYKTEHDDCRTKSGSYDAATKTIVVYIPRHGVVEDLLAQGFTMEQIKAQANTSKHDIFKQAHRVARIMTAQYKGTAYSVNFALALREIYRTVKAIKAAI